MTGEKSTTALTAQWQKPEPWEPNKRVYMSTDLQVSDHIDESWNSMLLMLFCYGAIDRKVKNNLFLLNKDLILTLLQNPYLRGEQALSVKVIHCWIPKKEDRADHFNTEYINHI